MDTELKIRLVATLSNAHIELNRNPEKSKQILTNLDKEFKTDDLNPYDKTKLNLSWAKVHRYAILYASLYSIAIVVMYIYSDINHAGICLSMNLVHHDYLMH